MAGGPAIDIQIDIFAPCEIAFEPLELCLDRRGSSNKGPLRLAQLIGTAEIRAVQLNEVAKSARPNASRISISEQALAVRDLASNLLRALFNLGTRHTRSHQIPSGYPVRIVAIVRHRARAYNADNLRHCMTSADLII